MWGRGQSSLKVLQDVFPAGLYDTLATPFSIPWPWHKPQATLTQTQPHLPPSAMGSRILAGGPPCQPALPPSWGGPKGAGAPPRGESLEHSDSDKVP